MLGDIIINGTSCGMYPEVDEWPIHPSMFQKGMVVMDTIYNPENTLMIKQARGHGATVVTGLDMFIRQAAAQFRAFTGQEPPVDLMRQVAKNALTPITVRPAAARAGDGPGEPAGEKSDGPADPPAGATA